MPRYRMVPVAPGAESPTDTARSKDHIVDLYEKLNALRKDADIELDRLRFRTTQMDDRMQELERRMPANPTAMDGARPYSFPTSTILDWRQLTQPLHLVLLCAAYLGSEKQRSRRPAFRSGRSLKPISLPRGAVTLPSATPAVNAPCMTISSLPMMALLSAIRLRPTGNCSRTLRCCPHGPRAASSCQWSSISIPETSRTGT